MLSNLQVWIPIAVSIVSASLVYWSVNKGTKSPQDKDRLTSVVAPVFFLIEDFLYRDISDVNTLSAYNNALDIISSQQLLAGYRLCEFLKDRAKQKYSQDSYVKFCDIVSSEYDRLCRNIGLPVRSFLYRLNYSQFKNDRLAMIKYFLFYTFLYVITLSAFLLLFVLLFRVANFLIDINPMYGAFLVMLFCLIALFVVRSLLGHQEK